MMENSKFIINKNNLIENLNSLKIQNVCAMVKADAYGHGLESICKILKDKVSFFGVATLEEALKIRKYGIKTPILIVGICNDFYTALKNDISITVESEKQFFEIIENLENKKYLPENLRNNKSFKNCGKLKKNKNDEKLKDNEIFNKKLKIHIKINSGMNRLGISDIKEFNNVLNMLDKQKEIFFEGIFTHFATAGNDKDFFFKQLKFFEKFLNKIPSKYNPIKHLGGGDVLDIINLEEDKNYMFRVGLKLYVSPNPVLKIMSKITKIHNLKKTSRVGYSNGFICEKKRKIAVIPLGYADGINRKLSNVGVVKINDKDCKIVGNVCMDMFFVDVTDINCKVGDEVTIFQDSQIWASICQTIPYEILTNLRSSRMKYIVE